MAAPPLQWSRAFIPVGGMDESIDPRIMPVGKALSVKNGQFRKRGGVAKRHGFTRLRLAGGGDLATDPSTRAGGANVFTSLGNVPDARGLVSTGTELCILGKRRLFAYSPAREAWYDRGQIGPCKLDKRTSFRDASSYMSADVAARGGYICHAAQRSHQSNYSEQEQTHFSHSVAVTVTDEAGRIVVDPLDIDGPTTALTNRPHAVRVCDTFGYFYVYWLEQKNASPTGVAHEMHKRRFDYNDPDSGFGAAVTIQNDVFWGGENTRTFDLCPITQSTWRGGMLEAYVTEGTTPDQFIRLTLRTADHALQSTYSLSTQAPYTRVAVCQGESGRVYVLAVADESEVTNSLLLYGFDLSPNLTLSFGPITLDTLATDGSEDFENLGVAEAWDGSEYRVSCHYARRLQAGAEFETREVSTDNSGSGASVKTFQYNCFPTSKPFWQDHRAYAWANSANAYKSTTNAMNALPAPEEALDAEATQWGSELFEHAHLWDLVCNQNDPKTNTRHFILSGLEFVGTGVVHSIADLRAMNLGSLNNVATLSDGRHVAPVPHWTYLNQGQRRRYSSSLVVMDYSAAPTVVTLARGALAIGGSFVTWYAGVHAEELGFPQPPILLDRDISTRYPDDIVLTPAGPTTLADGTYTYLAHWETYDEKGYLHRSMPSPPTAHTKASAGGENAVQLIYKTCAATNRTDLISRRVGVIVYRAGSDSIAKRITQPTRIEYNQDGSYTVGAIYDIGQAQAGTLYTHGGAEIENVAPAGANLVARAGDRLWLARGSQVQFSKSLVPGGTTEELIAPEFNEGFALTTPSGADVTGLAALDDQVAVLTERECYVIAGRGPNVDGSANDFSGMAYVSSDAGCIEPRSVASTPAGVMFQSTAGIYLLSRGRAVSFIGAPVEDLTKAYPVITSAIVVPSAQEVRFTAVASDGLSGVVLVFQYEEGKWSWWQPRDASGAAVAFVGACLHLGTYHAVEASGQVWFEDSTTWKDDAIGYVPLRVETTWLQPAQQGGWARVKNAIPTMTRQDAHALSVEVFNDFSADASQSTSWDAATIEGIPREALRVRVAHQKCSAIRVAIEDAEDTGTTTGEGYTLAGIALELGIKQGAVKVPANARG